MDFHTFTDFSYVYGVCARCVRRLRTLCVFCVRIRILLRMYTNFAHVVRLLRTYTALLFTMFNVDSLEVSNLEGSVNFFCPHELLVIQRPNSWEVLLLVLIEQ